MLILFFPPAHPIPLAHKKVALNGAEQNSDGNWVEAWAEQDMTDEEKAAYDEQKLKERGGPETVCWHQPIILLWWMRR